MTTSFVNDPWTRLREYTAARIALGRAGASLPTRELLAFQMHHARAIDAVYTEFDRDALAAGLSDAGLEGIPLETLASDRETYLLRPDYGRRLDDASRDRLADRAADYGSPDVVLAIVDGLSATAVHRHAAFVVCGLADRLRAGGFNLGPAPLVRFGRVALQDELGAILRARVVVSFIGERPGLGSPDSLGAYIVFDPKPGNTDANRNCVSNIRPEGLPYAAAIETIYWLITQALRRKVSGVALKDDRTILPPSQNRLPL